MRAIQPQTNPGNGRAIHAASGVNAAVAAAAVVGVIAIDRAASGKRPKLLQALTRLLPSRPMLLPSVSANRAHRVMIVRVSHASREKAAP